ncbi:MAG: cytochrome c oxidase subunit II [Nocardioides sp.]
MGVQLPRRAGAATRRIGLGAVAGSALLLSACSEQTRGEWQRVAMPEPVTKEGPRLLEFWQWSWVAGMIVFVLTGALILYTAFRYRRRHPDEVPVQTRYNVPLEILYTIVPIIIVVVFFNTTVRTQNYLTEISDNPDHVIKVVGQQWSWTFNYVDESAADGKNVYDSGTGSHIPELVLPVDETVVFELTSPDVLHSFWVIPFLEKEDVIPGKVNKLQVTPTEIGTYRGKCAELCGAYHSRMLFNVRIVSRADFDAYLQAQIDKGFWSEEPILGNSATTDVVGRDVENGGSE